MLILTLKRLQSIKKQYCLINHFNKSNIFEKQIKQRQNFRLNLQQSVKIIIHYLPFIIIIIFKQSTLNQMSQKPSLAQNKQPFDALAKVAVIGDSAVGKTNILLRYVNADYQMTHITTIGIDFKVKSLLIDGFRLKMQIWDTAGQERFRNLSGTIYQGAQAIILVYAINNRKTFNNVEGWMKDIADKAHGNILLAIVGNKCDLDQQRQVSKQEGLEIAKKYNAAFFMQTSAKTGTNVEQLFQKIGRKIKQKLSKPDPSKKQEQKQKPPQTITKTRSKTVNPPQNEKQSNNGDLKVKNGKVKLTARNDEEKKKKNCDC